MLTNGCFDLIHLGHVRYLEEARALGDALAVAVNGDESVRRLKGHGRPLIPEAERAEVVAGLAAVDWVVVFHEDTAESLVSSVRPAVYVKGGDYSADARSPRFPPEGRAAQAVGGMVRILELVPGRSTSAILERAVTSRPDGGYNLES